MCGDRLNSQSVFTVKKIIVKQSTLFLKRFFLFGKIQFQCLDTQFVAGKYSFVQWFLIQRVYISYRRLATFCLIAVWNIVDRHELDRTMYLSEHFTLYCKII